jgi:LexA-binding, inner membrane-associated putative hydrolase
LDYRQGRSGSSEEIGALAAKLGTNTDAAVLVLRVAADLCEDRAHLLLAVRARPLVRKITCPVCRARVNPLTFSPMASPIAHTFAEFWTFLVFAKQLQIRLAAQWRQYLPRLGVLVLLANLPDFDFPRSLGLLGNASLHHEFTHSLVAAVLVALAVSCVWRIVPDFWRSATIYFTAYGSHLLIALHGPDAGVDQHRHWHSPGLAVAQKISPRPWY